MQLRRFAACLVVLCLVQSSCGDDDDEAVCDEPLDASPPLSNDSLDAGGGDASDAAFAEPASDSSAQDAGAPDGGGTPDGGQSGAGLSTVLHTEGRHILDTCGEPWVPRGLEQIVAPQFSADGTLAGIVRELVRTGANAVRLLPVIAEVTPSELDSMLAAFAAEHIVVYISPGDVTWFARRDVKEVLLRHERGLILDAYQEPSHSEEPRWLGEVHGAIQAVRAFGYTCPITVLALTYGRNLPVALARGQEFVDADPLHNLIVGWQAYWGASGWYQLEYMMTLAEGVQACAARNFPMQIGIDLYSDQDDLVDYRAVIAAADQHNVGWLWWDWWNPWDDIGNNASVDGTYTNLTAEGLAVIRTDRYSIQNTGKKACFR